MGEARRKRLAREDATARGLPVPRRPDCPACGAHDINHIAQADLPPKLRRADLGEQLGYCQRCKSLWEAFPPLYIEDPVAAEPCDNCAFRPGSPEQQDPAAWRALLDKLRPDGRGWFSGQFYCHKGVPLDGEEPGNFCFPKRPDGTHDERRMRTCSGFLRMVWALNAKRESATEGRADE